MFVGTLAPFACIVVVPPTDDDVEHARDLNLNDPPPDEVDGMIDLNEVSFFHRVPEAPDELVYLDMKNGAQLMIRANYDDLVTAFKARDAHYFYFRS